MRWVDCRMMCNKMKDFYGITFNEGFSVGRPVHMVRLHLLFAYMHI